MKTPLLALNVALAATVALVSVPASASVPDCPETIFAYDPLTGNAMVYNCNGWDGNCAYQGFYAEAPGDIHSEYGVLDHGCDGICLVAAGAYLNCLFPDGADIVA